MISGKKTYHVSDLNKVKKQIFRKFNDTGKHLQNTLQTTTMKKIFQSHNAHLLIKYRKQTKMNAHSTRKNEQASYEIIY